MIGNKVKYCRKCHKDTLHKLVAHEAATGGLGIGRIFSAIASLGATETICADWYYQCQNCGEITKK